MTFSFTFATTRIFQLTSLASTVPSSSCTTLGTVSRKEYISQQKRLFSNQSRCRGSILPQQKKRLVTVATFPWSSMGPAKKNQEGTKKNLLFPDQSTLTHDQRNQEESPVTNTLFSKLAVLESTDFAPSTRVDRCTGWPFNKKCKMQGIPSLVIVCPDGRLSRKDGRSVVTEDFQETLTKV